MLSLLAASVLAFAPMTPPKDPDLRFVAYGDTRRGGKPEGPVINAECIASMLRLRPKPTLVVQTGDLVRGNDPANEWDEFAKLVAPIKDIYYPARGNHDPDERFLLYTHGNPDTYTLDRNGVRFVFINTQKPLVPPAEQYDWLKKELEDAKAKKLFAVPIMHIPLWSLGAHGSANGQKNAAGRVEMPDLQTPLHALFKENGVKLVFGGHDHIYYRTLRDGITYVVTGGGGAPLYDFDNIDQAIPGDVMEKTFHFCVCDVFKDRVQVTVQHHDLHGLVDSFTIRR